MSLLLRTTMGTECFSKYTYVGSWCSGECKWCLKNRKIDYKSHLMKRLEERTVSGGTQVCVGRHLRMFRSWEPCRRPFHQRGPLLECCWGCAVPSCLQTYICCAPYMGICESLPLLKIYLKVASRSVTTIHFNFFSKFPEWNLRVPNQNEIYSGISKVNLTYFVSLKKKKISNSKTRPEFTSHLENWAAWDSHWIYSALATCILGG